MHIWLIFGSLQCLTPCVVSTLRIHEASSRSDFYCHNFSLMIKFYDIKEKVSNFISCESSTSLIITSHSLPQHREHILIERKVSTLCAQRIQENCIVFDVEFSNPFILYQSFHIFKWNSDFFVHCYLLYPGPKALELPWSSLVLHSLLFLDFPRSLFEISSL